MVGTCVFVNLFTPHPIPLPHGEREFFFIGFKPIDGNDSTPPFHGTPQEGNPEKKPFSIGGELYFDYTPVSYNR
jgi:hypothetical protein